MKSHFQPISIILSGIVGASIAVLLSFFTVGIGFLLTFIALLCLCVSFFGILLLPKKSSSLYNFAKTIRIILLAGFVTWVISLFVVEGLIIKHSKADPYTGQSYILVLGAGLNGDQPSLALLYRLQTALDYLKLHPTTTAILCGGRGAAENLSEAEAMKRWLTENGLDENRLILEDQSQNTIQNIENALHIIQATEGEIPSSVAVLSNDFHVWRASMIANRFGVRAIKVPSPTPNIGLLKYSLYLREYFSLFFFILR